LVRGQLLQASSDAGRQSAMAGGLHAAGLLVALALAAGERVAHSPSSLLDSAAPRSPLKGWHHRPRDAVASAALLSSAAVVGGQSKFFLELDTDRNGVVSAEEYRAAAVKSLDRRGVTDEAHRARLEDQFARVFAVADIDGDSLLGRSEVEFSQYLAMEAAKRRRVLALREQMRSPNVDAATGGGATNGLLAVPRGQLGGDGETDEFGLHFAERLFSEFDEDGDGQFDESEYRRCMHARAEYWGWGAILGDPEVAEWIDALREDADVTGDGSFNQKELYYSVLALDHFAGGHAFQDKVLATELFRVADANFDGNVDEDEIVQAIERAAAMAPDDGRDSLQRLLRHAREGFVVADEDGSGSLDADEGLTLARSIVQQRMSREEF